MKKFFLVILTSILLSSCSTTVYQLTSNCDKISSDELFKSISTLLIQENFSIKQSDMNLLYLRAETEPIVKASLMGMIETRIWTFQLVNGKIIATARQILVQKNAFGNETGSSEKYYNDKVHKSWGWYWNVRNGLENLCGDKIIIVEKETN